MKDKPKKKIRKVNSLSKEELAKELRRMAPHANSTYYRHLIERRHEIVRLGSP